MGAILELNPITKQGFVMNPKPCKIEIQKFPSFTFFYHDGNILYPLCYYYQGKLKPLKFKEEISITKQMLECYFLQIENKFVITGSTDITYKALNTILKKDLYFEKQFVFKYNFLQSNLDKKLFTNYKLNLNVYEMETFIQFMSIFIPLLFIQENTIHLFKNVYLENLISLLTSLQELESYPKLYFEELNQIVRLLSNLYSSLSKLENGQEKQLYNLHYPSDNVKNIYPYFKELQARNELIEYMYHNEN